MVSLDEAVIARLESDGHKFEILIDPEAAQEFRENGEIDWDDALATEGVWSDSAKGDRASDDAMQETFGTRVLEAVCTAILERGDIQLTAAQRKALVERRYKQLVAHIAASAMNPQTGTPHPPQRIENALAEAKFMVDPLEPLERQVERAVKALRPLLPISFEKMRGAVVFCLEPVQWPRSLDPYFQIDSILYQGARAIVRYDEVIATAYNKYHLSLGAGLNQVAGKVFRIGHLGDLTELMIASAIVGAEMAMLDNGFDIKPGSGIAAASEYWRKN